jgi:hypothetical protein
MKQKSTNNIKSTNDYDSNNFLKIHNFNISTNNNNNNFDDVNYIYNQVFYLENKNLRNNITNNFGKTLDLDNGSQKQLKYKINMINNYIKNKNIPFNISKNNNTNFNLTLKNNKENDFLNKNDIYLNTHQVYLETEPENQGNLNTAIIKKISIKKSPYNLESNLTNSNNNINRNYLKTNQNQSFGVSNTPIKINNNDVNNLELQFKRCQGIFNSHNKPTNSFNNESNTKFINNNSNSKPKSNSKTRKNNLYPSNMGNTSKNLAGSFSKKYDIQIPLETYSSQNDFIDDFFFGLQNYISLGSSEDTEKLIINKNKVLNIFDNIFKKIITGQKPMESLDIEIKKKLSKYSETWKNFLLNFEKSCISVNAKKNSSYINNINLSTKNVVNHNHNLNTEPCANNSNPNVDLICGKNIYTKMQKELEEKFTNLMKKEVSKIKGILEEKEKLIDDLQNQIKIKNSYISEIQIGSILNAKSKDLFTSNLLLKSENFSKDKQDKIFKNKINNDLEVQNENNNFIGPKNNCENQVKKNDYKNTNINNLSKDKKVSNENEFKITLNEEADNLFIKKKTTDTIIDEQTELLLYDRKQFIRERRLLIGENKSLFDKVNEMEKTINFQKEKEVKLMKLLFFLNKQGFPIDEIIQNHVLTEKSDRDGNRSLMRESAKTPISSYQSMDSLMYLPITLDKPMPYVKPQVIPILDFTDINNNFNLEYDSGQKSIHLNNNIINSTHNLKNSVNVNESSSSFFAFNKIKNERNCDNSIINNISKLDHKKNRRMDERGNLNQEKIKNTASELESLSEDGDLGNSLKIIFNKISQLNLKSENNPNVNTFSNHDEFTQFSNNIR